MTGPILRLSAMAVVVAGLIASVMISSPANAAPPTTFCQAADAVRGPHLTVSTDAEIGLANGGLRFCKSGNRLLMRNVGSAVWHLRGTIALPADLKDIIGETVSGQRVQTFFNIAGLAGKSLEYIVPGQVEDVTGDSSIRLETDATLTAEWYIQKFIETRIGAKTIDALKELAAAGSDKREALVDCGSATLGLTTAILKAKLSGTSPGFDELYSAAVEAPQCRAAWDVAADFWSHGFDRFPGYDRINVTPSLVDAVAAGKVASKARPVIVEVIEILISKVRR